jgi:hypothetical protein
VNVVSTLAYCGTKLITTVKMLKIVARENIKEHNKIMRG